MLRLFAIIWIGFAISLPGHNAKAQHTRKNTEQSRTIEKLGSRYMQRATAVGLTIGVLSEDDKRFFSFGSIAYGSPQCPNEDTIFEIGSISKVFTGMLLAQACQQGLLGLDDDVRDYLSGPYPNLEYSGVPVRLFQLLNHTSGLPFQLPHDLADFEGMTPDKSLALAKLQDEYSQEELIRDLHAVKLTAKPGEKLNYSNTAAQLLGHILADRYKTNFATLVQREIFLPLGLKRTCVSCDTDDPNRAIGYNCKREQMPLTPKSLAAAGAICSTTSDLLRFAEFHLDLKNKVAARCQAPTWGDIQYYAIGLNWQMEKKPGLPHRIWQSGRTGGFTSLLVLYPESRMAIAVLANESCDDSQDALFEVASKIFNAERQS